ncbi:heavy-metal-associated domain-containing protein [Pseudomonas abieticivorans]|uniref:heavy-metal-associated domain-containing protein n=1 Tax=Pseudomonas abieticivorans TaxID=2931382 RepID=UPI0020BF0102|nr:heavy-metal-associated domain-containing protein [Pseudomonas sp. PIA16]
MQQFNVQGMTCGHCVKAVTRAIQGLDPQAVVEVDLSKALVRVQSGLASEVIEASIKEEGYAVAPL